MSALSIRRPLSVLAVLAIAVWEIADLDPVDVSASPTSRTMVRDGALEGRTLRSLIAEFGSDFLGSVSSTPSGDFPLLMKFLDAREHLSVQVHPTATYVATHPGSFLKTESWYVVKADQGSVMYLGFRPGVRMEQVAAALGTPAMVPLMQAIPAIAGEFHHLPAGTVHALGSGVSAVEVQTPSDTTFRLYDWTDEYGRVPRQLHLQEGLAVLNLASDGVDSLPPMDGVGARTLVESEHYWQREHRSEGAKTVQLLSQEEVRILVVLLGTAEVRFGGAVVTVDSGSTLVVPASCAVETEVVFVGRGALLETGISRIE